MRRPTWRRFCRCACTGRCRGGARGSTAPACSGLDGGPAEGSGARFREREAGLGAVAGLADTGRHAGVADEFSRRGEPADVADLGCEGEREQVATPGIVTSNATSRSARAIGVSSCSSGAIRWSTRFLVTRGHLREGSSWSDEALRLAATCRLPCRPGPFTARHGSPRGSRIWSARGRCSSTGSTHTASPETPAARPGRSSSWPLSPGTAATSTRRTRCTSKPQRCSAS